MTLNADIIRYVVARHDAIASRRERRQGGLVKIIANQALCSGHARCAAVAPEVFDLNDDGYIGFSEKEVPPGQEALARRGVRACPERALAIEGDDQA
jgi:ferredoxin